MIMDLAVRDRRIGANPCNGVGLPRAPESVKRYLTADQVRQLADASGRDRTLVLVLAYYGLRIGEAAALRVADLDLMRRRIRVEQSVTHVDGRMVFGTPKTHQRREVPLPAFLVDLLALQVHGKCPADLVFPSPEGSVLRTNNWRRWSFDRAAAAVGLEGFTPHELRHTAASLAVASGARVKAVQRMLGHASAAMPLDVYAGRFGDDLDALAERLDSAFLRSGVPSVFPGPEIASVVMISDGASKAV